MKTISSPLCFFLLSLQVAAQSYYYPPLSSDEWESTTLEEADLNPAELPQLITYLQESNTKGFILLKNGKVVIEEYFGNFNANSWWYWASAGKSLAASLVGIAQEEGHLSLNDYTSTYLGKDWTECQTDSVRIIHHLTMTTGFDYTLDFDCTAPECLQCLNEPGTEWYYHNGPYTLTHAIVEKASNIDWNEFTDTRIEEKIGMNGRWIQTGDINLYWSSPRSMARFGHMILSEGQWDGNQIIEPEYFQAMTTTSQNINQSYGYLWWLNGKSSFRSPGTTFTFPGYLVPNAPADMIGAFGKNGQMCMVIPSLDMVIVRMGESPDNNPIPVSDTRNLWDHINPLFQSSGSKELTASDFDFYPRVLTPGGSIQFKGDISPEYILLKSITGSIVSSSRAEDFVVPSVPPGTYIAAFSGQGYVVRKIVLIR